MVTAATNIIQRLTESLSMEGSVPSEHTMHYTAMQSYLLGALQAVLKRLSKEDALQCASHVMQILFAMFQTMGGSTSSVAEDSLMAVSALVNAIDEGFVPYVEQSKGLILACLSKTTEHEVYVWGTPACNTLVPWQLIPSYPGN